MTRLRWMNRLGVISRLSLLRILWVFAAFLVVDLKVAAQTRPAPAPPFWQLSNQTSQAFVLGTIHLLDAKAKWMTPEIEAAFNSADTLLLELSLEEQTSPRLRAYLLENGTYPPGERLADHIDSQTYKALRGALAEIGMPVTAYDRFKPWTAAIMIELQTAMANGYRPDFGVDHTLGRLAAARDIRVLGLESGIEQLQALQSLTGNNQIEVLELTLEEIGDASTYLRQMRDAWLGGDLKFLEELVVGQLREVPAALDVLITNRNKNWVPRIKSVMAEPGTYFIAVGAGHLIGPDGLLVLLENEGFDVQRLSPRGQKMP